MCAVEQLWDSFLTDFNTYFLRRPILMSSLLTSLLSAASRFPFLSSVKSNMFSLSRSSLYIAPCTFSKD